MGAIFKNAAYLFILPYFHFYSNFFLSYKLISLHAV